MAFRFERHFDMVWVLDGTRQKAVRSTTGYSKLKLQRIVDELVAYLIEQGSEFSNSEEYNAGSKLRRQRGRNIRHLTGSSRGICEYGMFRISAAFEDKGPSHGEHEG